MENQTPPEYSCGECLRLHVEQSQLAHDLSAHLHSLSTLLPGDPNFARITANVDYLTNLLTRTRLDFDAHKRAHHRK